MWKTKKYFLIIFFMAVSCVFLFEMDANAAKNDFYKKYSGSGFDFEEYSFKLKHACNLTISMEFLTANQMDTLTVDIIRYDEDGEEDSVFWKMISGNRTYQKKVTLPAGEYGVIIESEGDDDYYDDDYYDDDEYYDADISNECRYSVILSGEYIPELSTNKITLEEGKSKTLQVNNFRENIKWNSSNKSVAAVSGKGVVKAKKAGKATITATCGKYKLSCKVTVTKKPVSYNTLAKKMKEFAKKNKNFTFKTIDAGRKCRLYAGKTASISEESKIYSEGYFMVSSLQPYIECVKKKNQAELSLRMEGYLYEASIYSGSSLFCGKLNMSTSNRKLNFKMTHTSGKYKYNYSNSLYECSMRGYAAVSTSSKVNSSNLKKFETMLGQNSLVIRIVSMNGAYLQDSIPAAARNNWKKLVKEYNILLKEY